MSLRTRSPRGDCASGAAAGPRRRRAVAVAAALGLACVLLSASSASATTVSYSSPGSYQFTVPIGVSSISVTAVGAAGGAIDAGNGCAGESGGRGASVSQTLAVSAGAQLSVVVGGVGGDGACTVPNGGSGGSGGGGAGGAGSPSPGVRGAGGGGASLVGPPNHISPSAGASTGTLLLVAAGGGGAGGSTGSNGTGGDAGANGTSTGAAGGGGAGGASAGGSGGISASGNPCNGSAGAFAQGGAGGSGSAGGGGGGGGGGGYYGGGGGGGSCNAASGADGAGGGGGSSFVAQGALTAAPTTQPAGVSITYTVAAPPTASIVTPVAGGIYILKQVVDASYSCQDGSGGSGIRSCAGPVASGSPIDTSTIGPHSFTVTATSQDGESTSQTVSYTVVPGTPDNHFTLAHVKARGDGSIAFAVTVPGPGQIDVLETAGRSLVGSHAALLGPGPGRFALLRSHVSIGGGTKQMHVTPSARFRRAIARWRRQHRAVTINFWVTYTPTGGNPRNVGRLGVLLIR